LQPVIGDLIRINKLDAHRHPSKRSFYRRVGCGKLGELVVINKRHCAILCLAWFFTLPVYAAEYYRWVDDNGVVHITDNLHNVPENQRPRAGRIQAPESPRSREPEKKAAPTRASIPIEKHGQVVVIQATLNNKQSAKFIVDTGASYTMISTALARDLSIDTSSQDQKTMPFQTANGMIQAPITNLDSITVGGIEIKNLTAAVHDAVPDPQVAGLLGLNFLSNFRMDIDTQRGLLHLEKK
jgi:clan AA aspartic protease (TIGR02281 family)